MKIPKSASNFRLNIVALSISMAFSSQAFAEEIQIPEKETEKSTSKENVELQEVVVTGTKRSQVLQEAVQSVTVFEEQDTIGMQYGLDVLKYVPNITLQSSTFLPTVRGLDGNGISAGGGGAVSGANPRMTNYIDGVARTYGASPDGMGSFWDIEQIEVYKGSQSTQLGRNSIAGAIVQTTKDPKFKDEYAVQAGVHDQNFTYNAAFMANKKISDQLAIRFTGETINGENFIDYSNYQGPGMSGSDRGDLGDTKYTRYRFKALLAPTDFPDLLVKLSVDSERSGNTYSSDSVDAGGRDRELTQAAFYTHYASANNVTALSADYTLNSEWSISSILSYQNAKTNFGPPIVGNPNPADHLDFTFSMHETVFEPKVNYHSKDTRTNAVIGAYYLTRSRNDSGKPGSAFALTAEDETTTRPLYADSSVQVSDSWDILLGGRLEQNEQKRNFSAFGGLLALNLNEKNDVFLPKVGATYHFTEDASLSLLSYKGYTPSGGGVSFTSFTPYLYDKETATTTELVSRTQWLNRKLTANANIFYTRLKDAQVSGIGPSGPNDGIYVNAEKVKTYGAEFALTYAPNKKDKAFLSVGLLNTEIEDFGSAANNANNGNELAFSPDVTARIGGYSEVYPNLTVGGDVSYSGKRYSEYQNSKENELDSYSVTNVNARYQYKNATITGYVNNLFNQYVVYAAFTGFGTVNVNAPRTVGLNVRLDF